MQIEDPYVFPQETQMDFPNINVAIQTDTEENTQADCCMIREAAEAAIQTDTEEKTQVDCCMIQEAVEAAIQTDPMETQDDEVQTEETPTYILLIMEVITRKLQNELAKTHEELTQHKKEVVPLRVQQ